MNSKGHYSNSMSLNDIHPDCDGVIGEFIPIKEEASDDLPVENVKNETTIIDDVSGEQCTQGIFIKAEINLENIEVAGDSTKTTDEEYDPLQLVKVEETTHENCLGKNKAVKSKL